MVRGLPLVEPTGELCETCLAGKERRTPFPQQAKYRAEQPLELVDADLCGAVAPPTPGGRRYFLLLVDDYSRFMWLVLLTTKDEAGDALKRFQAEVQTEARCTLRTLRTDRGGEFSSNELAAHFADIGVKRHLTAPYSPQQNGVVERRNQTVVGMARSMMKAKKLPSFFWGEAVTTAVHVLNRTFTRSVDGRTPYEAWHGRRPSVEHFRVFGCIAHVKSARPSSANSTTGARRWSSSATSLGQRHIVSTTQRLAASTSRGTSSLTRRQAGIGRRKTAGRVRPRTSWSNSRWTHRRTIQLHTHHQRLHTNRKRR